MTSMTGGFVVRAIAVLMLTMVVVAVGLTPRADAGAAAGKPPAMRRHESRQWRVDPGQEGELFGEEALGGSDLCRRRPRGRRR